MNNQPKFLAIIKICTGVSYAVSHDEFEAITKCVEAAKNDWGCFIEFNGDQAALIKTYDIPENSTGWHMDGSFLYFESADGKLQEIQACTRNNIRYFR